MFHMALLLLAASSEYLHANLMQISRRNSRFKAVRLRLTQYRRCLLIIINVGGLISRIYGVAAVSQRYMILTFRSIIGTV
jgi:hypothetical protein